MVEEQIVAQRQTSFSTHSTWPAVQLWSVTSGTAAARTWHLGHGHRRGGCCRQRLAV